MYSGFRLTKISVYKTNISKHQINKLMIHLASLWKRMVPTGKALMYEILLCSRLETVERAFQKGN